MPLNLTRSLENEDSYNYNQLRFDIIGNKDLKFRLFNDVTFMNKIVHDFNGIVANLLKSNNLDNLLLDQLEKLAVILNILISFALELIGFNNEETLRSIQTLEQILVPICSLLNYFIEKHVPSVSEFEDGVLFKIEAIMRYSLDMVIGLSNLGHSQIDAAMLWRYLTVLLLSSNQDTSRRIYIKSALTVKSLRLVPILLSSKKLSIDQNYIPTLLETLLKRLSNDCYHIIYSHIDGTTCFSKNLLFKLTFEDETLPNANLKNSELEKKVDMKIIIELVTSVSQIISFLKSQNYHVVMEFRNDTKDPICLTAYDESNPIPITHIYLTLLLLLKSRSKKVGLSAINLLTLLLEEMYASEVLAEPLIYKNFEKLFPKLIDLLDFDVDYDGTILDKEATSKSQKGKYKKYSGDASTFNSPMFLKSAAKILADLCVQYPSMTQKISDTNINNQLSTKLSQCFNASVLLKKLKALKMKSKHGTVLVDFTSLKVNNAYDLEIADLLLLLSVYTSDSEESRHKLLSSSQTNEINLPEIIFEIIDNYHFLCNQIQLTYKIVSQGSKKENLKQHLTWLGKNLGAICALENSAMYTNCFYFIRSNSRSVSALRTFFVECNEFKSFVSRVGKEGLQIHTSNLASLLSSGQPTMRPRIDAESSATSPEALSGSSPGGFVTNILEIIRLYESLDQKLNFFFQINNNSAINKKQFRKTFMTNKAICISLLANFILDFSSFRYKIISYENFLSSLSTIYQKSSEIVIIPNSVEENYENCLIQLKILQVIKNFMFNEASENKREVLNYFPVSFIFHTANYGVGGYGRDPFGSTEVRQLKIDQKIVAFEILRNFTAGSPSFTQILRESYVTDYWDSGYDGKQGIPINWPDFVLQNLTKVWLFLPEGEKDDIFDDKTLITLLGNEGFVRLVRSINFTEDHTFTAIDNLKKDLFPNDQILSVWLRYLSFEIPDSITRNKEILVDNLNLIKLSIAWILVNLTWKSTVFGYDLPNYTDYEVYQTVDTSTKTKRNGAAKSNEHQNAIEEESSADDELTVTERAKILDAFGFTKAIYNILDKVAEKSFKKDNKVNTTIKTSTEHDVFEKLRSALRQINYLTEKRNPIVAEGFDIPEKYTEATSSKNLGSKIENNVSNTVDTTINQVDAMHDNDDEEKVISDDEIRYERSRRRDAIDSEDDSQLTANDAEDEEDDDNEDEEMATSNHLDRFNEYMDDDDDNDDMDEDDDSDEVDVDEEATGARHDTTNESADSDDDELPHEYWVM
ncbi:uncharacterized protein KGF55_002593 [Candida pseudojiufengensis]|uniref:uncharacterized protein n=1 Tax=Candida pseudojiufengensis TaxID=497109 RepID=UPI002225281E|nr:uncharacterized protein KGF55_002593 [Candida pseudojiufengensis]KAI5963713.1 hypothetical protein KGF55_002593 [Candida pseudojiufengensis]